MYGAWSSALSGKLLHELQEDGVFHGIENAYDLPERLEALWTYAAGHVGVAIDGLPDGWLRYTVPAADTNMARWPVHPAWVALQAAFSARCRQEPRQLLSARSSGSVSGRSTYCNWCGRFAGVLRRSRPGLGADRTTGRFMQRRDCLKRVIGCRCLSKSMSITLCCIGCMNNCPAMSWQDRRRGWLLNILKSSGRSTGPSSRRMSRVNGCCTGCKRPGRRLLRSVLMAGIWCLRETLCKRS